MLAQTYVRFASPITVNLRLDIEGEDHPPNLAEFSELPLILHIDAVGRTITAQLPPVPAGLEIYGPEDFVAACPDEPEDFAQRVLQILGSDPAATLQALVNGIQPELPPRIPRVIRAWQGREILRRMGLLATVQSLVEQFADTAVTEAWEARENLARRGRTVLSMADALGLSEAQVDQLFISAGALEV